MKSCLLIIVLFFAGSPFAQNSRMDSLDYVIATSNDPAAVSEAYVLKAQMNFYSDAGLARQEVGRAIAIALEHRLPLSTANAYSCKGILHIIEGDFLQAHTCLDSAILIFEMLKDVDGLSRAHGNKAIAYLQQHNYSDALDENFKSMMYYEKENNQKGVALAQTNIGTIYHNLNDYDKALKYYLLALDFFDRSKTNVVDHVSTYANISSIYTAKEMPDSAIFYAQRLLEIGDSTGMILAVGEAMVCYGRAYIVLKKFDEAFNYYEKALALFDSAQSPVRLLTTQVEYVSRLSENGFYDQSTTKGMEILKDAIDGGFKRYEADIYLALGNNYAAQKDYKKAFEFKDKYLVLEKEIMEADHLAKVAELDVGFQMQRKEDQIKLLEEKNKNASLTIVAKDNQIYLDNAKIRTRNFVVGFLVVSLALIAAIFLMFMRQRKLSVGKRIAELEHRALRVQMNPHFIFNSMNSIQQLYVEGKTDQASDYMADFANLMRRILDNSSKESITLEEEIKLLKMYLELENIRCGGMIDYSIEMDDDINSAEKRVPPMIIQPFVENAIWHGILPKNTRGNIEIRISKEKNKKIIIVVQDDGVGFTAKRDSSHEPKGMKITEQRLGNPIEVETPEAGGTRIILTV